MNVTDRAGEPRLRALRILAGRSVGHRANATHERYGYISYRIGDQLVAEGLAEQIPPSRPDGQGGYEITDAGAAWLAERS